VSNILNEDEIPKRLYIFHILAINLQDCVLSKHNEGSESFEIITNER